MPTDDPQESAARESQEAEEFGSQEGEEWGLKGRSKAEGSVMVKSKGAHESPMELEDEDEDMDATDAAVDKEGKKDGRKAAKMPLKEVLEQGPENLSASQSVMLSKFMVKRLRLLERALVIEDQVCVN